jgi:cellulose biosynthesis protein BcsQ
MYAFYGCSALTEVKLPASLTSISNYTFRNCTNLTTVTIPASVTKIGSYVFNGCNNLKVVYFEGTEAEWAKVTIGSNNNSLNQAEVICTGVERPGVLVFEENFDYADNSDTISVLDIIGWSKLTKAENRVYSETDAEFAIIDGSPGIGCPVIASLSGVDLALIVAEPSVSGISDLERIVHTAGIFHVLPVVCVNKYDTNIENTNKIEDYCYRNDIPFMGRIPFDLEAVQAINSGQTIVDRDCAAGRAVKEIYDQTMQLLSVI